MSGTKGCIVLSLMFVSITLDNEARLFGSTSLWTDTISLSFLCPPAQARPSVGVAGG